MRHAAIDDHAPAEVAQSEAREKAAKPGRNIPRVLVPAAGFAAIWWVLNPGDPASWIIGAPAVAAATATVVSMPRQASPPFAPGGALRFAGFFAVQTVVGATDVALRAFNPFSRVQPGFISWKTRLPEGAPRVAYANAITLLPGTLTARMEGEVLTIHVLDTRADPSSQLDALERRIAAMFALDLEIEG